MRRRGGVGGVASVGTNGYNGGCASAPSGPVRGVSPIMPSSQTAAGTGPDARPGPDAPPRGRYFALAVLFSMNLLNYVDRYSFFAVGTQVQAELGISNQRYGVLGASFMIVYTVVSPLIGLLGDRYDRRLLLSGGVGLWSLATVGTAFSRGFADMFFWRALLGLGEATYGVIAPALLADLFPARVRGRVMGLYFLALPLGGALGYVTGGGIAQVWHWRAAFWVVGLPGLAVAAAGLALRDPGRGASDGGRADRAPARRPTTAEYLGLFRTPTFLYNTAGLAAVTFATGAYAVWGSVFYQSVRGMLPGEAGLKIGGMSAAAGLLGIGLGTWITDRLLRRTPRAYLLVACGAVALAVPPSLFALTVSDQRASLGLLFTAMVLMAMVLGPCNTVTANVVPADRRSVGFAANIFLIHLLGDISSPILIGVIADFCGRPSVAASALGGSLAALGALPVRGSNLTAGMLAVVPVMTLGAAFFALGSRHLPDDQDRAHAAGGVPGEPGPVFGH